MIVEETEQRTHQSRFIIQPNLSLSWRGNLVFFLIICSISFGIAGIFTAMGYWIVFPFAGLEMVVLGAALYSCSTRAHWCEMVCIGTDTVEVAAGRHRPERRWTFNRHWARIVLNPPRFRGHPSRLLIRSHGKEVEVGSCLSDEEREQLARALDRAMAH